MLLSGTHMGGSVYFYGNLKHCVLLMLCKHIINAWLCATSTKSHSLPAEMNNFIELEIAWIPSTKRILSFTHCLCTFVNICEWKYAKQMRNLRRAKPYICNCMVHKTERISGNGFVMLMNSSFEEPFLSPLNAHCKTHAHTHISTPIPKKIHGLCVLCCYKCTTRVCNTLSEKCQRTIH